MYSTLSKDTDYQIYKIMAFITLTFLNANKIEI